MSEVSRGSVAHAEQKEVGPNYFGYYVREISELFSQNEEFIPPFSPQNSVLTATACANVKGDSIDIHYCNGEEANSCSGSSSLFSNGVGDGVSDFKRERLKASLKQSVTILSQEVDEMLDPVLAMYQIQTHLRDRECLSSYPIASDRDVNRSSRKKQKISSSPSSTSIPINAGTLGSQSCGEGSGSEDMDGKDPDAVSSEESQLNFKWSCVDCKTTKTPQWRGGPAGPKSLCNACWMRYRKKRRAPQGLNGVEKEKKTQVNEDLQILLESGGSQAKEAVKKYSDELSAKLGHMEHQLEELLDIVVSKCRQMTLAEKQQLRTLIQNLPPKNLDRVVEIVQRSKLPDGHPCDEIHIDLELEDNLTLWRLYYYVEAVSSAKKLSS